MERGPRPDADVDVVVPDITRTTYRYLRISVVALALLVATSLTLEIVRADGERFGSISAYFYSPVRSVLVGALFAFGPALIAIKGRRGWEDTLLDVAGMVILVVALVPASRDLGTGVCGAGSRRCVPPELVPSVVNNVTSLVVLGVAVLVFAWWSAGGRRSRETTGGLLAASVVLLVFAVWFWAGRTSFLLGAHYVAAVVFFLLIAGAAWLNGRRAGERVNVRLLSPTGYRRAYRTIGALMVATIVLAVALAAVRALTDVELWYAWVFAVEAVLLVLFVTFWVLQTAENWDEEAVECR